MTEENVYRDGDIVWVKMNKLWWPGEVHGSHRLPSDFFDQVKKPPLVVVKFFQEHNYHNVNQLNQIAPFNCTKKSDFIKKGLDLYYAKTKHKYMEEFPADVAMAETRTGGDPNIIYSKQFIPVTKPDNTNQLGSTSKGTTSRSRRGQQNQITAPIAIPRVMIKPDHHPRILATSAASPKVASETKYKCTLCNFGTDRINTFVWHQKSHNSPKTPQSINRQLSFTENTTNEETTPIASAIPNENIDLEEDTTTDSMPVATPKKTTSKRQRQTIKSSSKSVEKKPKTENKLKNILDDWLDDDMIDDTAGPSASSKDRFSVIVLDTDDEDDTKASDLTKKRVKLSDDIADNTLNGTSNVQNIVVADTVEIVEMKLKPEDNLVQELPTNMTPCEEVEITPEPKGKKRSIKANSKDDDATPRQSGRLHTKIADDGDTQSPIRSNLRSGRALLNDHMTASPQLPKRRGRSAKLTLDESLTNEVTAENSQSNDKIGNSETDSDPSMLRNHKVATSPKDLTSDEVVDSSVLVKKEANNKVSTSSNSRASRKGKPRRKEEIKLANNISVAVLVEKTTLPPSTDNEKDQKCDDVDEFTNVVHKKIRYMSHSSSDDHRKSIETPKLREEEEESKLNSSTESKSNLEILTHKTEDSVPVTGDNENNSIANSSLVLETEQNSHREDLTINELISDQTESSSTSAEVAEEHRHLTQKDPDSNIQPKTDISSEESVALYLSPMTNDESEPSSSNFRQKSPKRYENTRSLRKSERRRDMEQDMDSMHVEIIDQNCEEADCPSRKSIKVSSSSNDDTTKTAETLNDCVKETLDQCSESSNSKTSTPEKADTSKELDCFDFTEDEYLKLPPQVLNRRKRLPPAKVFELDDIDKIEEQRKLDEDALRIAKEREEDNQKLQIELENLLDATTPAKLPEIPITPKVHENFPERRAEKDPEKVTIKEDDIKDRTLPPKERKKRIFKYRNRNRHTDSDTKETNTNYEPEINNSLQQSVSCEEKIVVANEEVVEENKNGSKLEHSDEVDQTSEEKNPTTAHDLQIEIAETLINFLLLSPQIDGSEQKNEDAVPSKSMAAMKRSRNKLQNTTASASILKTQPTTVRKECTTTNQFVRKDLKISTGPLVHENEQNLKSAASHVQTTDNIVDKSINSSPSQQSIPADSPSPLSEHMVASSASCSNDITVKPFDNKISSNQHIYATSSTQTVEAISSAATSVVSPIRDFSRIRLIEKIDNHTPIQSIEEITTTKSHPLPLKKSVVLTQTEGSSFIAQIPKKRKSQMDDDIPAFVIKRPKDIPDDSNDQKMCVKKEPKSFIVTKSIQKQVTGVLPKANVPVIAENVFVQKSIETNNLAAANVSMEASQQEIHATHISTNQSPNVNMHPIVNIQNTVASPAGSPVIMSGNIIVKNSNSTKSSQNSVKRTVTSTSATAAQSNLLSSLSIANRPCTIAPAKKASYRKPTDMTGLTQKQIGIDGKGNPVMIYTKISPIVTQTPSVQSQSTFVMKRNEPSTSQPIQSFTPSLQSNPSNQFVITSKGALITNKFVNTTQTAPLNRSNFQMQTQIIRSNPQVIHQQQQQQHQKPNQVIVQTKSVTSRTSAPAKRQPVNRRNVANKQKQTEPLPLDDGRSATKSGYLQVVNDDNTTIKKRIVRRMSKTQSTAISTPQTQSSKQQIVLNSDINHVSSATTPVPPLIPIATDQLSSTVSRTPLKKPPPAQMAFVQETRSETPHVDIIEQQQENVQEILALPGDTFGGPAGSYFLCKLNELGVYIPIDHQPLYLDVTDNTNLLKPNVPDGVAEIQTIEVNETEMVPQSSSVFQLNNENERIIVSNQTELGDQDANNPKYLINIGDGQQLLVDQQSLMALANGEDFPQFVTPDGHQIILQSGQNDILSAIAFAEDVGLIAGQQILIPEDDLAVIQGQGGGNHDILAAALAGTEAFSQEQFIDNVLIQSTNGVEDIVDQMVYHTIPQPTVTALTNETNAVLTQPPIMSTLEQPTKTDRLTPNMEIMGQNLDESLAVIGVTSNTNVPTSLELPITITNPAIAPKTTSMSSAIYPSVVTMPSSATDHDLEYDLFSSTLPISHHHLTQSLAINENYRSVNVVNSIGDIDLASASVHQSFETN